MPSQPAGPPTGSWSDCLASKGQSEQATTCRAAMADAERLFAGLQRLDSQLDRFRRYSHDQLRLVMPVEDDRWHVPGEPPAGPQCHLCIKADLGLLLRMVLPATPGRAA